MANGRWIRRRGALLMLRVSVPCRPKPYIGQREITLSLATCDRRAATRLRDNIAPLVNRLFDEVHFDIEANGGRGGRGLVAWS